MDNGGGGVEKAPMNRRSSAEFLENLFATLSPLQNNVIYFLTHQSCVSFSGTVASIAPPDSPTYLFC